jgi:hypothetical protein
VSPRFPLRSIGSTNVGSGCPVPSVSAPRCVLGPFRSSKPDPPRRCVDLQRFPARRSRSFGFPAPPPSLDLSVWTLASSAGQRTGWSPIRSLTAPGLTLALEDHVRVAVSRLDSGKRTPSSSSRPAPLRFLAPPTHPARGIHFPALRCSSGFHRTPGTAPRRGVPPPLRSAFAVSHDPDGFPLLGPCGLFHPHTPLGFSLPAPHGLFRTVGVLRPYRRSSGLPRSCDRVVGRGGWSSRERLPVDPGPA